MLKSINRESYFFLSSKKKKKKKKRRKQDYIGGEFNPLKAILIITYTQKLPPIFIKRDNMKKTCAQISLTALEKNIN